MGGKETRSTELRRLGRAGPNAGEMELLRAATLPTEPAADAWRRWLAAHDIDEAYHRSTDLLPAISANLPSEVLAEEADRLRGIRRRVWADNQFGRVALVEAAKIVEAEGAQPVVVKGAALASTVYTEPGTRAMADVDLLIGADNFVEACDALFADGWQRVDPVEGPFFHAVAVVDERGRNVDVHKWVVFPRFSPMPERSWLERAVPLTVRGHQLRRLASSDEIVLSVLHGMLTNSPSATRWPIDVVQLARMAPSAEADFWDSVVASASEVRAGPIVGDALAMCRTELGAEVPVQVLDELAVSPLDKGAAQHWSLCRRGITLEWRVRRYARLERSEGRRPSVRGYVHPRTEAIRTRGLASVLDGRVGRVKQIFADRTRD
jgi:hypothetical protein